MKGFLFFLLLVFFQSNFDYTFDYRLEYEYKTTNLDTIKTVNHYVNSKDNSYFVMIQPGRNVTPHLYFRDSYGIVGHSDVQFDSNKPKELLIPKTRTIPFKNNDMKEAEGYEIIKLTDTLINDKKCARMCFRIADVKKAKRRKIATHVYIIDTNIKLKPLLTNPEGLAVWSQKKVIPDGLLLEELVYTAEGELVSTKKLKEYGPIDFKLQIETN